MKKLQFLLIVGLLVAVGTVYRSLHEVENNNTMLSEAPSEPATLPLTEDKRKPVSAPQEFAALLKTEADAMSQLNDRPEEVQKRLKDLADKMQEADVLGLQAAALNTALNGDQRFLSVYVLGKSTLEKAQESLETIATAPIPVKQDTRLTSQEEVIRGQAVESLQRSESLKRVLAQTDNAFITDRAQRNLLFREGKVSSSPEQQDQKALTQLLKKSTH